MASQSGIEGTAKKTEEHITAEGQPLPRDIADSLVGDYGFRLYRNLLSEKEVDTYRLECEGFFKTGPRIAKWPGYGRNRLNRDQVADYVFSRPNAHSSKIYQFPANPHSPDTQAIFDRVLSLRDAIEEHWPDDRTYFRTRAMQRDYIQVNRYLEGQGIGKHRDSTIVTSRPLVQCVVLMSQPQVDFLGGELVLYTQRGEPIRAHKDLGMRKCDSLLALLGGNAMSAAVKLREDVSASELLHSSRL